MKHLVIITDCYDIAAYEIKGKFYSLLGKDSADISIDIVAIKPFSIIHGQFSLRLLADSYPEGTCFYVVLNPVKHQPLRVLGKTKVGNFIFCGRNTGVFDWLAQDFGCQELYEVSNAEYCVFGGKNIYPQVLSEVLKGADPKMILPAVDVSNISKLTTPDGTVVHVDNFGIVKVKGQNDLFSKLGVNDTDKVDVFIKQPQTNKPLYIPTIYNQRIMALEDKTMVVCQGSSIGGIPEIASVRNAEWVKKLNIKIGDMVCFSRGK